MQGLVDDNPHDDQKDKEQKVWQRNGKMNFPSIQDYGYHEEQDGKDSSVYVCLPRLQGDTLLFYMCFQE